jgi:hypothetical protein
MSTDITGRDLKKYFNKIILLQPQQFLLLASDGAAIGSQLQFFGLVVLLFANGYPLLYFVGIFCFVYIDIDMV